MTFTTLKLSCTLLFVGVVIVLVVFRGEVPKKNEEESFSCPSSSSLTAAPTKWLVQIGPESAIGGLLLTFVFPLYFQKIRENASLKARNRKLENDAFGVAMEELEWVAARKVEELEAHVARRLEELQARLEEVEAYASRGMKEVEARLKEVEAKLEVVEAKLEKVEAKASRRVEEIEAKASSRRLVELLEADAAARVAQDTIRALKRNAADDRETIRTLERRNRDLEDRLLKATQTKYVSILRDTANDANSAVMKSSTTSEHPLMSRRRAARDNDENNNAAPQN